jgi:protein disulfide-isomerase-like protein
MRLTTLGSTLAVLSYVAGKSCEKSEFYGKTSVVDLCDSHFPDKKSENIWMIEFYAPWCGHCKALKPEYIKAAKQAKKNAEKYDGIKFGAVDCTKEQYLCQKYGVQGYPTLKGFVAGKAKDYQGPREADGMLDFVMSLKNAKGTKGGSAKCSSSLLPSGKTDIVPLCASHFPDSRKGKHNWVVVFHAGDKASDDEKNHVEKLVSQVQGGGAKLGVVDCSNKSFCESKLSSESLEKSFVIRTYMKGGKASDATLEVESLSDASGILKFVKEQMGSRFEQKEEL